MATKFSSSNSMSFEIRSLATPSKISSDLRSPAPTAANQQHSRTYNGSPAYPERNLCSNSISITQFHLMYNTNNHYSSSMSLTTKVLILSTPRIKTITVDYMNFPFHTALGKLERIITRPRRSWNS